MRLTLFAAVALLAGCVPAQAPAREGPPAPQVLLYGVRLSYFKGSEKVATATASQVAYQRASSEFSAGDVKLRLLRHADGLRAPGGTVSGGVDILAPTAKGALSTRQADGEGGVELRTGSGLVGKTPQAHFDGLTSSVSGPGQVHLRGPGYRLTSQGFAIDLPSERFTFAGAVTSRFGEKP